MIKAIIVDDEKKGVHMLRMLLEENCPNVKVVDEAYEIHKAEALIKSHHPQLIFLDIDMGSNTGFDLLEKVKGENTHVIFVTAHSHFAVKAFRFSVADYLLKPVDIDELKQAVHKVKILIEEAHAASADSDFDAIGKQTLRIPSTDGTHFVYFMNIIRMEADGAYTNIYINTDTHKVKTFVSSYNLKQFEEHLDPSYFMRVHRSHVINLKMIRSVVDRDGLFAQMADDALIEISKRTRTDFLSRIH